MYGSESAPPWGAFVPDVEAPGVEGAGWPDGGIVFDRGGCPAFGAGGVFASDVGAPGVEALGCPPSGGIVFDLGGDAGLGPGGAGAAGCCPLAGGAFAAGVEAPGVEAPSCPPGAGVPLVAASSREVPGGGLVRGGGDSDPDAGRFNIRTSSNGLKPLLSGVLSSDDSRTSRRE